MKSNIRKYIVIFISLMLLISSVGMLTSDEVSANSRIPLALRKVGKQDDKENIVNYHHKLPKKILKQDIHYSHESKHNKHHISSHKYRKILKKLTRKIHHLRKELRRFHI